MEPHIENFTKIENFIQNRPVDADRLAQRWNDFVGRHPEISHFQFKQEFDAWATTHNVSDTTIWVGKEIRDAYFYLRQKHEEEQMEHTGHVDDHEIPSALAALGFLGAAFSRERPKILEEDPHFKRILEEKKEAWMAKNPGKDINSKEWLDYRYGSLENPEAETLYKDAENTFREKAKTDKTHETLLKKYDEERKKVYDDPKKDPTLIWHQEEIDLHTQARHELLEKTDPTVTIEHTQKQVEQTHWERFAKAHPEKAAAYAPNHGAIKEALAQIEKQKEKQGIHDQLTSYQQTTGKEIHYVEEKTHRPPEINIEASKRLESIVPAKPTSPPILQRPILPSIGLVDAQGRPIGSIPSVTKPTPLKSFVQRQQPQFFPSIPRMSSPINSGGMPQPSPTSQPPPPGGRGIGNSLLNKASNLIPGLGGGNPLTNLAKNAALRSIIPILAPILIVSIFTFAIVFGAIGGEATIGEASPEIGGGTISANNTSCQLTRLGESKPIKSSTLANLINQAAQKKGVPAIILASLARHESPDFTANADDNHDNIKSGNYCHPGQPFCEYQGKNLHSGECKPDDPNGARTGKAMGLMQIVDIYNIDIDTCNIQQNIERGAEIFKSKLGEGSLTNENDVKKAVCRYFGIDNTTCIYTGTYDYGKEVWNDFQNCQQTSGGLASSTPTSSTNVLTWVEKINSVLEEGPLGDFNKMIANITNGVYTAKKRTGEFINTTERGLYWCTNLVIDTYNLIGKTGLNDNHQAVISMRNFWKTTPGYIHLDYLNENHQSILSRVSPGYVVFFEQQPGVFTGNEHVAIVKTISIDSDGKGFLETYDANTNAKTQRYPIVNWDIKNQRYKLVAFGTAS